MAPLPLGIIASAGGFEAVGGTFTVDANGYRHHIFNSSATLTVSGEKPVFILVQNGGNGGQNDRAWDSYGANGNSGGAGGSASYLQGTASSNITVTVAGAGGSGSVSGVTTSQWQTSVSSPAGGNRWYNNYFGEYQQWYGSPSGASNGSSGTAHSSKSSIYTGVANLPSTSGGGGGAGGFEATGTGGSNAGPTSGGTQGGGNGGSIRTGNGNAGGTNTGGGGGGGAVWFDAYGFSPQFIGSGSAGAGGSGYVVISYQL